MFQISLITCQFHWLTCYLLIFLFMLVLWLCFKIILVSIYNPYKYLGLSLRILIELLREVWLGFVLWRDSSLLECWSLAIKSEAFFQYEFLLYITLFLKACIGKECNEQLNNLSTLGYLCKQSPWDKLSINRVLLLVTMSIIQNSFSKI